MPKQFATGLVAVPFVLGAAAAPAGHAHEVFSFQDSAIIESSGLVVVDGLVVTTNDSGDTARVFTVDPADGRTVGVTGWGNDATDVEALAPRNDGEVWVGDIGDNTESRDTISVAAVPVGPGDRDADAPIYDLAYPDGPHNAETLMADPETGRLYVATKEVFGGTLYAAPARLSPDRVNRLHPVGDVLPIATDGAFLPDGKHLVVRNYSAAVVYAFPSLEKVAELKLPDQPQGEGIAVEGDGSTVLLSSEGVHSDVLRVGLPPLSDASSPSPSPTPSPAAQTQPQHAAEPPPTGQSERPVWPWLLGGLVGVGCIVVLLRSLRPL